MTAYFSWSHQSIQDFLCPQLWPLEFHHELVIFVDSEDATSVQMAANGVNSDYFFPYTQVRVPSFLKQPTITCRGIILFWEITSSSFAISTPINYESNNLGEGKACRIIRCS